MGQEELIITLLSINKISSQACFCRSYLLSTEFLLSHYQKLLLCFISLANNSSSVTA